MAKNVSFVILCVSVLLFLGGWGAIVYGLILWTWPLSLSICLIGAAMFPLSWVTFFIASAMLPPTRVTFNARISTSDLDD